MKMNSPKTQTKYSYLKFSPLGWKISYVKYLGNYINGYPFKPDDWSDQGKPILRIQNLSNPNADLNHYEGELSENYLVRKGDILISWSASLGVYKWLGEDSWLNQHIFKVEVNHNLVCDEYFIWLASWFIEELAHKAHGSTMQHLTSNAFGSFPVLLPPISEQKAIARYLDRQTAKIDELIKAKKRLLELLDEKRRALITHAVTRGLNPDVPMRDSGVEWIGEIPKHWELIRLRRCIFTLEQGWSPQADEKEPEDQEWGVLKLNAVKRGQFDDSKAKTIPVSLEIPTALEINPGDFLITRANTPELVGDVCYVHKTRPQLILSDLIYRLRLDESKLHGQFLSFFLQTHIGRLQIEADARGSSSSMVKISQGHILNWLLLLPPPKEQESIVDYIEAKLSQINALKTATEHTIKLLEERRTALITAAVNGQIKIKE